MPPSSEISLAGNSERKVEERDEDEDEDEEEEPEEGEEEEEEDDMDEEFDGDVDWAQAILDIRNLVRAGSLDEAMSLDCEVANLEMMYLPSIEGLDDSQVLRLFSESELVEASMDDIDRAVGWASSNPDLTAWTESPHLLENPISTYSSHRKVSEALPSDVNKRVMDRLLVLRMKAASAGGALDWASIGQDLHRSVCDERNLAEQQRRKPCEDSVGMALYNHDESSRDCIGLSKLHDAVLRCRLEPVVSRWNGITGTSETAVRAPLAIPSYDMRSCDVDGDLLASCGDLKHDSTRESRMYVGVMKIDSPYKPDHEENHFTNILKSDMPTTNVLADCLSNTIWACRFPQCNIVGLCTESRQIVASLQFPDDIRSLAGDYCSFRFALTRCADRIVAGGGSKHLVIWSIPQSINAMDAMPVEHPAKKRKIDAKHAATSDDSETDEEDPCEPNLISVQPQHMLVVEERWSLGDCQRLTDSTCVVSGCSGDAPEDAADFSSLSILDLQAEKVVSILAGHREAPSLSKQLLVGSHQLVCSMESSSVGLIFDLRTASPAFTFPKTTNHMANPLFDSGSCGILGVPTCSSPVAFTWAKDECVRCWDLRAGVRENAWLVSTGNLVVRELAWHAPSASLFASTQNEHEISHGRYGAYRYGESVDDPDLSEDDDGWPPGATHSKSFFPELYHNHEAALLRYAFSAQPPRVPTLFALAARQLRTLQGVPTSMHPAVTVAKLEAGKQEVI